MVTIYVTEMEAKLIASMCQNTITDWELKNLAGRGKHDDMLKAMRDVKKKIDKSVERG